MRIMFLAGIDIYNAPGMTVTLQGNTILRDASVAGPTLYGIYFGNVAQSPTALQINSNNTISDAITGISSINVVNFPNPAKVDNNTVSWTTLSPIATSGNTYYGIRMQGCFIVGVDNNIITESGTTVNSTIQPSLIGIEMENSPYCVVTQNNITSCGTGILSFDQNNSSQFACNIMTDCYYGLWFNGTTGYSTVGDLLSGGIQQGNQWNGTTTSRLAGAQGPSLISFNYGPGTSYDASLTLSPFLAPNPLINPIAFTSTNDNCSNNTYSQFRMSLSGLALIRDEQFGDIVKNRNVFPQNGNEIKFNNKEFAFRYFKNNPNELNLGQDDSAYVAFYDSVKAAGIGNFELVNSLIDSIQLNNAFSLNSGVSPASQMEGNRKSVNDIYLYTGINHPFKYDSVRYSTLLNIAQQNPLLAGDAVYSARVMLGLNFNFSGNYSSGDRIAQKKTSPIPMKGKVYPNPNDGTMQFDYSLAQGNIGEFVIYSLSGVKVAEYRLAEGDKNTLRITEPNLVDGIYFYTEIIDGAVITNGKLIIIK